MLHSIIVLIMRESSTVNVLKGEYQHSFPINWPENAYWLAV